jgi:hypothetical protein
MVPLTDLGMAEGTTSTAEDDKENNSLLVADMVMLDMTE